MKTGETPDDRGAELLVQCVVAAVNNRALYPGDHPRTRGTVDQLVHQLEAVLAERQQASITMLVVEDDLVVDQRPLAQGNLAVRGFVRALRRLGVEGLTLLRGLTAEETARFLDALAERSTAVSTDHIQVGWLRLAFEGGQDAEGGVGTDGEGAGSGDGAGEGEGAGETAEARRGKQRGVDHQTRLANDSQQAAATYLAWRRERRGGLAVMERLIWSAISALAASAEVLLPIAALRGHDELTFAHSLNVALLVLGHGRALGLRGEVLKDVGLGALLHDIGKLALPPELLHQPGRMSPAAWELVRRHPEIGAGLLCELADAPPIAVLVAYEHHLRYDGQPSYPQPRVARRPNLASALTAVADTYDSFVGRTPTPARRAAAFTLLRRRAGNFLDPVLVASFCQIYETPAPAA